MLFRSEFAEALDSGLDEIVVAGQVMNPHLHLTIHEVVANQVWEGDPPEVTETARRLDRSGYDRHEVFHMIGSVMSEEMWLVMRHHQQADLGQIKRKLAALPGSWESQRDRGATKGEGWTLIDSLDLQLAPPTPNRLAGSDSYQRTPDLQERAIANTST